MIADSPSRDELLDLLWSMEEGEISDDGLARIDHLVRGDEELLRFYVKYTHQMADFRFGLSDGRIDAILSQMFSMEALDGRNDLRNESWDDAPETIPLPIAQITPNAASGYFFSGWPAAYLIATLIFAIGAVVGAFMQVATPVHVARDAESAAGETAPATAPAQRVGRIVDTVDCKWVDSSDIPRSAHVAIGCKYALVSGLLEIAYDTGARVILQGPCSYEVDSTAGGFLSIGKLTARVGERGERRGESEGTRSKGQGLRQENLQISNSQSRNPEIPKSLNPSSSPQPLAPSPLFTVRTPTAVITDLGTEFGVEVGKSGATTSHVFQGSVRVQTISTSGEPVGESRILRENESACVEGQSAQRTIRVVSSAETPKFIRAISKPTTQIFDLVDVVAGGDGFSGKRGGGINPLTGQPADNAQPQPIRLWGDYKYHPVEANPFVDGVFIPDGSQGPVQLDSAGHAFNYFGTTLNRVTINIWGGGQVVAGEDAMMLRTTLDGVDYSEPGRGLIFLAANSAITFDLDAIRRANPNRKFLRFRAVAGNAEIRSLENNPKNPIGADIWVFVDGELQFKRRDINYYTGAFPVNVRLGENNRFLTLVATDAGGVTWCDWTMFGEPRLEFIEQSNPGPQRE